MGLNNQRRVSHKSHGKKSDKETQSPILKVFRDIMHRDKNDSEKTTLLVTNTSDKKRKHSSGQKHRIKKKSVDSSGSEIVKNTYVMKSEFKKESDLEPQQQSLYSVTNIGKSTKDSDETYSCVSCALKKLISNDYLCIGCLVMLFVISVMVACGLIYRSIPCWNTSTSTERIMETERLKRKIDSFGFRKRKNPRSFYYETTPNVFLDSDNIDTNLDMQSDLSRVIGLDKIRDIEKNMRLKEFYQRLLQVDNELKLLKKVNTDVSAVTDDFKYKLSQDREKRSISVKHRQGRVHKRYHRHIDKEKKAKTVLKQNDDKVEEGNRNNSMSRKVAKCSHAPKDTPKSHEKSLKHPFYKNSQRLDELLDELGKGKSSPKLELDRIFGDDNRKCNHQKEMDDNDDRTQKTVGNSKVGIGMAVTPSNNPYQIFTVTNLIDVSVRSTPKTESYRSITNRKLMQTNDDDNGVGYEDFKEVLSDAKEDHNHDEMEASNDRIRQLPNEDDPQPILKPVPKFSPMNVNNPNWKGPMPLYPDELTALLKTKTPEHKVDASMKNKYSLSDDSDLNDIQYVEDYIDNKYGKLAQAYSDYGVLQGEKKTPVLNSTEKTNQVKRYKKEFGNITEHESDGFQVRVLPSNETCYDNNFYELYMVLRKHIDIIPKHKRNVRRGITSNTRKVPRRTKDKSTTEKGFHFSFKDKDKDKDRTESADDILDVDASDVTDAVENTDITDVTESVSASDLEEAENALESSDSTVVPDANDITDALDSSSSNSSNAVVSSESSDITVATDAPDTIMTSSRKSTKHSGTTSVLSTKFLTAAKHQSTSNSLVEKSFGSKLAELTNNLGIRKRTDKLAKDRSLFTRKLMAYDTNDNFKADSDSKEVLYSHDLTIISRKLMSTNDNETAKAIFGANESDVIDDTDDFNSDHSIFNRKLLAVGNTEGANNSKNNHSEPNNNIAVLYDKYHSVNSTNKVTVNSTNKINENTNITTENDRALKNLNDMSDFFTVLSKLFQSFDSEDSKVNISDGAVKTPKAIAPIPPETDIVYPNYDADMVDNIGHRSRMLLSINVNETDKTDKPKVNTVTPNDGTNQQILKQNVTDVKTVQVTTNPQEIKNVTNVSKVKRNIADNLMFWNDIYDDEYGVKTENNRRGKHSAGKDVVKKSTWLRDKVKLFADNFSTKNKPQKKINATMSIQKLRFKPKMPLASKSSSAKKSHNLTRLHVRKARHIYDRNNETPRKTDFVNLTAKMKDICKKTAKTLQETKSISVRDNEKDAESVAASNLMQHLVGLMSDLVDFQVEQQTCMSLPPDLKNFLEWLVDDESKTETQTPKSELFEYDPYKFRDHEFKFKDEPFKLKDDSYKLKDDLYKYKDDSYKLKDEPFKLKDDSYKLKDDLYKYKDYLYKDDNLNNREFGPYKDESFKFKDDNRFKDYLKTDPLKMKDNSYKHKFDYPLKKFKSNSHVTPQASTDFEPADIDTKSECLNLLQSLENLMGAYETLSEEEKTTMSGVKEYIAKQIDYLQRRLLIEEYTLGLKEPEYNQRVKRSKPFYFKQNPQKRQQKKANKFLRNYSKKHTRTTASFFDEPTIQARSVNGKTDFDRTKRNLRDIYYKAVTQAKKSSLRMESTTAKSKA